MIYFPCNFSTSFVFELHVSTRTLNSASKLPIKRSVRRKSLAIWFSSSVFKKQVFVSVHDHFGGTVNIYLFVVRRPVPLLEAWMIVLIFCESDVVRMSRWSLFPAVTSQSFWQQRFSCQVNLLRRSCASCHTSHLLWSCLLALLAFGWQS